MENITNKRQLLIGKKVGWAISNDFVQLYTITKFSVDGKKYYRTYDDNTGEWMPTDSLLMNLERNKLVIPELSLKEIFAICKNRNLTSTEKAFNKQLSFYENYGSIRR